MRKIFVAIAGGFLIAVSGWFGLSSAAAHKSGPSFVKVNGVLTTGYPVQVYSDPDLILPQEMSSQQPLVGETIHFTIDEQALSLSLTFPEGTRFLWDFGDNEAEEGISVTHTYKTGKSYRVDVYADDPDNDPQQIESLLLNVLPNKDYVLPAATIAADGKTSTDPVSQPIVVDLEQTVHFSATAQPGSAPIASYYWDFGDTVTSRDQITDHSYGPAIGGSVAPLLRVTDANGFFFDSFVWLKDDESAARDAALTQQDQRDRFLRQRAYPVLGTLAGLALLYAGYRMYRQRQHKTKE